MVLTVILLIAIAVASFLILNKSKKNLYNNLPPGPPRLPFVGGYFHVLWEDWRRPAVSFRKFSQIYKSPVISFGMGPFNVVVANSQESIREVFANPVMQGRPEAYPFILRTFLKKIGIFDGDGLEWLHLKRKSLRDLRDIGFGRRSDHFERIVEEEAKLFLDRINAASGQPLPLPDVTYPPAFNAALHLVLGTRFPDSQLEEVVNIGRTAASILRKVDGTGRMLAIFPWIRYIAPKISGYEGIRDGAKFFEIIIREIIEEHRKNLEEGAIVDLIGNHLKEQQSSDYYTDEVIISTCTDLLFPNAGVSFILSFAIIYLLQNPDILKKCQQQCDNVVGRGRLPTLNDRQNLPMIEATVRETMRIQTLVPLGVGHLSTEDTTLGGYDVPKNSIIITNLEAMNMEPSTFGDPEVFRPERFLDTNGMLAKIDRSLPFGLGKRVCAGETFARQNLFIFLATIIQNFDLEPGPTPIDFSKNISGLATRPQEHLTVRFIPRL